MVLLLGASQVFVWMESWRLLRYSYELDSHCPPGFRMVGLLEAPTGFCMVVLLEVPPGFRMVGLLEAHRFLYGCTLSGPRFSYG